MSKAGTLVPLNANRINKILNIMILSTGEESYLSLSAICFKEKIIVFSELWDKKKHPSMPDYFIDGEATWVLLHRICNV
jgi:hypothetical protein